MPWFVPIAPALRRPSMRTEYYEHGTFEVRMDYRARPVWEGENMTWEGSSMVER